MKITREILRQWGACYSDEQIAALVSLEGLTAIQVADLEIPAEDRLWVVLREDVIPARDLRRLACRWARGALDAERAAGREPAPQSWAAVETAERFARGEATAEELAAAWAVAWTAWADANDAASAAAWAAWADASVAANDAASAAASAVASTTSAARAAWAVARNAAWAAQVADVRAYLAQKGEP